MTPADVAVGAPERLHPFYLLTGIGGSIRQMIGAYAAVGYFAATGSWTTAVYMLVGIAVFVVAGVFLYWRRFEYRVGANEIRVDSGILSRTHRSIPFDRIHDVDISQGPVARLLGLAKVRFETGGSAGAEKDDGTLVAIALARAEAIRDQVRARRGTTATDAVDDSDTEAAPIFAMDVRRVLLAGLFNFSLAIIAGLFGAMQSLGDVARFNFFSRRFWRETLDAGSPIADFLLAHQIAVALAGTLALLAIGLATGVVRTLLRDYRFRLDRTETGLRRRRGLLTLSDVTLPLKRAQSAIIGTGPLRDRFGWRELRLQSLGNDEGKTGDHVVAPLAGDGEVAAILAELGWRGIDPDIVWQRASPAYFWGSSVAVALLLVPATFQALYMPWLGAAGYAVVAAVVFVNWLAWRRYRYTLDGDRLLIRSGWWRRRLVMLPLDNIQSVDLTENIVSRRFGTASLTIGVASGRGYSSHGVSSLPRETARALRTRLLSPFA